MKKKIVKCKICKCDVKGTDKSHWHPLLVCHECFLKLAH